MRTTSARLLITTAAAALVAVAGPAATARAVHSDTAPATSALQVTGFQEVGDPNSRIVTSAAALTTVGVDGVNITANGSHVGRPSKAALKAMTVAHKQGLRAEFLIGNFGKNDFNESHAHNLLSSSANITAVATSLIHSVTAQGWNGISVDLESLRQRDGAGLVEFLAALHNGLPAGDTLSVNVSLCTTARQYHRWGYDLKGIAATVSRVILMAYDEHGSWENHPGPVGALSWQKRGLATMEAAGVPASEIDLGEAGYGYAWRPHSNDQVSDAQARRMVTKHHGKSHFNSTVGEWTAHLSDGTTIWWADARSYQIRAALAAADGLHGLAVWSLGLSDPIAKFPAAN